MRSYAYTPRFTPSALPGCELPCSGASHDALARYLASFGSPTVIWPAVSPRMLPARERRSQAARCSNVAGKAQGGGDQFNGTAVSPSVGSARKAKTTTPQPAARARSVLI